MTHPPFVGRRLRLPLAVAIGSILPATLVGQDAERYTVGGSRVEIYNLVGAVQVVAGDGDRVVVEVARGGRDADQLGVETGPIGRAETLRVIYPDDQIVYRGWRSGGRTEVHVRRDGTFYGGRDRGPRNRVRISGSGRGLDAFADLTIRVPRGQSIGVFLGAGDVAVENVDGDLLVDVGSADVTARRTRGSLTIDTGSGQVEVWDVAGDVNVDTGSGSVDVTNVNGRRVLVDTGSGSVTGRNITAREVLIDTGSGRVGMDAISAADVRVDTGSGSVHLDLVTDVDVLLVDTGSGSITVGIPDVMGAEVDVETSSGGIDFEMPVTVRRFGRNELRGTLGDGRGRIQIDTGSGAVRFVRRAA